MAQLEAVDSERYSAVWLPSRRGLDGPNSREQRPALLQFYNRAQAMPIVKKPSQKQRTESDLRRDLPDSAAHVRRLGKENAMHCGSLGCGVADRASLRACTHRHPVQQEF